jgi:hypothetical protein
MSTRLQPVEKHIRPQPAKQPYSAPLLTRNGTVEELTHQIASDTAFGSGIPTDFASTQ